MNGKMFLVMIAILSCSYSALAQDHEVRKMRPEDAAALHADYARFIKESGIDASKPTVHSPRSTLIVDTRTLGVLEALNKHGALAEIGLSEEQFNGVNATLQKFRDAKQQLASKSSRATEKTRKHFETQFRQECRKLCAELSETLVAFQAIELIDSTVGSGGLLKLLTEPNLASKYVDLSDSQVRRLREKHEALGEEIEEYVRKKRVEASKIFEDELDMAQKRRLVELFGAENISQMFESASAETLMRHSGIKLVPQGKIGPKIKAWRSIGKSQK